MRILIPLALAAMSLKPSTVAAQELLAPPCACTKEFRSYPVRIVDGTGRDVTRWTATIRGTGRKDALRHVDSRDAADTPTGGTVVLPEPGSPEAEAAKGPGTAMLVVADDGMLDDLSAPQTTLTVHVRSGNLRGEARFVVGFTGSANCRCHVSLVTGPDRIVLR